MSNGYAKPGNKLTNNTYIMQTLDIHHALQTNISEYYMTRVVTILYTITIMLAIIIYNMSNVMKYIYIIL